MADVVESLSAEFESTLAKATVVRVVRHCRRELAIDGSSATDMLHTRAQSRLRDRVAAQHITTDPAGQHIWDRR